MTDKIQTFQLERRACVYVRQSTRMQVLVNTESTARQYALVERAHMLGWPEGAVDVIDEDLGRSSVTTDERSGFRRLADAVAHGEVGAIFALEVSRLARCSQDWQRLFALCAVAQVVVVDEETVYDLENGDDKLLLNFKSAMSEAELHWLKLRLTGAAHRMARRGALRFPAATGYVWGRHGFELDPDLAVRSAIGVIFERFAVEPTAHAVVRWAAREGFQVPTRRSYADGTSELTWKPLAISRLKDIIKNPTYAGVYAHGRRTEKKVLVEGEIRRVRQSKPRDQWLACILDAHEGYITWETHLSNLEKMRENAARRPSAGAPREGRALLTGIVLCGRCGRRMQTTYAGSSGDRWTYICHGKRDRGQGVCWSVRGRVVDAAVEDLFLQMIIPSELELSLAVEREVDAQTSALHEQWKLRLDQAEYEARRAERRYKAVDPDNRVVARTLESEWEARLRDLEAVRQKFDVAMRQKCSPLSDENRARIRELARDLPAVWRAPTTTPAERKAMLRIAVEIIALRPIDIPKRLTHIEVQWRSGAVDELTVQRPSARDWNRTPSEAVDRIRELAASDVIDRVIAARLNADNVKSGSGHPWTGSAVKHVRLKHSIACSRLAPRYRARLPDQHPDGRYSIRGVMRRFGVSYRHVTRWIKCGLVQATREDFEDHRGVWWLVIDDATATRIENRRTTRKRRKDAEVTDEGGAV